MGTYSCPKTRYAAGAGDFSKHGFVFRKGRTEMPHRSYSRNENRLTYQIIKMNRTHFGEFQVSRWVFVWQSNRYVIWYIHKQMLKCQHFYSRNTHFCVHWTLYYFTWLYWDFAWNKAMLKIIYINVISK